MIEVESWPLAGAPTAGAIASLIAPCSRVSHDLLTDPRVTAAPARPEWWFGHDPEHPLPAPWAAIGLKAAGRTMFGSSVDLSLPPFALTARLAEIVQDHLTGYEFIQWPACPGHRHLLLPDADESEAWWKCPDPGGRRVRIGALEADS